MADTACEWCDKTDTCKYAYDESDCRVSVIKTAKLIVNPDFIKLFKHLQHKKEVDGLSSDDLDGMLSYMENIIIDCTEDTGDIESEKFITVDLEDDIVKDIMDDIISSSS